MQIQENILLADYTSFGIGGPARYFVAVDNKDDLIEAIKFSREKNLPYFILGGGSNLLVNDEGFEGVVIKIKNEKLKIKNFIIQADAGVLLSKLMNESINNGLTGLEWAVGIPGTLGGAICGNSGAYRQSISQAVESVEILDAENLEIRQLNNQECCFAYRESIFKKKPVWIILSAVLKLTKGEAAKSKEIIREYLAGRKNKTPLFPSAGCVFKNLELKLQPESFQKLIPPEKNKNGMVAAGYLIEQRGLKGKKIGAAQISEQHANFIVNLGGAKAQEVIELIKLIKKAVKEKFNVKLEEEIRYLK